MVAHAKQAHAAFGKLVYGVEAYGWPEQHLIRCIKFSSGRVCPNSIAFLRALVSLGSCCLRLSTSSSTDEAVATMCCILLPNCGSKYVHQNNAYFRHKCNG